MWVLCVLFFIVPASAKGLTAKEYSHLPRLFHLDDYDNCLANEDGLYCLGVFELSPIREPHYVYNLMKTHTSNPFNFNRMLIHRGFCLNKRCPSEESNMTLHFEQCADAWAQRQEMKAKLHTLHYCRTKEDLQTVTPPTKGQVLFIQVLYTIIFLNIIGTAYDLMMGNKLNKNRLLMAWSIPGNWNRLTQIHKDGDPRQTSILPVKGIKILGTLGIIYAHTYIFEYGFYIANPEYLEKLPVEGHGVFMSNGVLAVHMFFTLTAFLTTYNLLLYSEKQPLKMRMLPMCLVKRISRISPLYLFFVGYAATWWTHAREGPLISTTIGRQSNICIKKFWTHAFYVNNIIDGQNVCLHPTWYFAADLQLYTMVCFLTIIMWKSSRQAIPIYAVLFFGSCIFSAVACYLNNWKTILFISTSENLRKIFEGVESYSQFYTSTWGALAACFMGMFIAHVHYELQKNKVNLNEYKLAVFFHNIAIPAIVMWIKWSGKPAREITSPVMTAIFIAVERIVFFAFLCISLLGFFNIDGPWRRLLAWSRWHAISRLSFAVTLLHWFVGMVIAARPQAYNTSVLDAIVDYLATIGLAYMMAIPAAVLLEIPFQRSVDALF